MSLEIEILRPGQFAEWEDFIEGESDSTIFHSPDWYSLWPQEFQILVARENDSIFGGIIVTTTNLGPMKITGAPPLTPVCRPVLKSMNDASITRRLIRYREAEQLILSAIKGRGILQLHYQTAVPDPMVVNALKYRVLLHQTYEISPSQLDNLKGRQNQQTRRNTGKAAKLMTSGRFETTERVDPVQAFKLIERTSQHKGFARAFRSQAPFVSNLIEKKKGLPVEIFGIVNASGELQACTVVVHDKTRSYYLAGGIKDTHRASNCLNYALFEWMIRRSLERGNVFDFEGSMNLGVEHFFRGWGGDRVICYRLLRGQSKLARFGLNFRL